MCFVENEDVVGAAPTGDAPTTSELSTYLLLSKVRLILEVLRYEYAQFPFGFPHMIYVSPYILQYTSVLAIHDYPSYTGQITYR